MKRTLKKSLSVILAAAIMLCSAPLTGLLDLDLPDFGGFEKLSNSVSDFFDGFSTKAEAATSGKCGDNLTWTFNESTGTLTISGTGDMYNYYDDSPWGEYLFSKIKNIVIGSGVTSIGSYAFFYCFGLNNVTIPHGVTSIGDSAFRGCEDLYEVSIPDSVNRIGDSAFGGCLNLSYINSSCEGEINIPSGVEIIEKNAFSWCWSFSNVNLSEGLKSIGPAAFDGCFKLTSLTIPESVETIGAFAFHDCNIKSVTIPEGVKSIGVAAFSCMDNLNEIFYNAIDCEITTYSGRFSCHAFDKDGIGYGSATHNPQVNNGIFRDETGYRVNVISRINIGSNVKSIPDSLFYNCNDMEVISIPNSVTSIGNYAFFGCDSLTSISVDSDNSVYSSDEYGVLFNKEKTQLIQYPIGNARTNYIIPDSVTSIGNSAFEFCDSLTSITIPDSVTSMGDDVFSNCDSLTSVTIGNSVTSIGDYVFWNCDSLTSITIPDSVTSIGDYAFFGCTSLTSVTICNGVKSIGNGAFDDCISLTSITIPDSVTSIGDYAFHDCESLTSITIPDSVTSIGYSAFNACYSLTDVYYSGTEEEWNAITIAIDNECLINATIHYNCVLEDDDILPPYEDNTEIRNFKVMSYNVYSYNKVGYSKGNYSDNKDYTYSARAEYIEKNILDNSPDSVGLQEVTGDFFKLIYGDDVADSDSLGQTELGQKYDFAGEFRNGGKYRNGKADATASGGGNNEACLILYDKNKYNLRRSDTFWLSDTPNQISYGWEDTDYRRICTYALLENKETGDTYVHFNTHISHNDTDALKSMQLITEYIECNFAGIPVVLTGDFNHKEPNSDSFCENWEAPYYVLTDNGYRNVKNQVSQAENTVTYHDFGRGNEEKIIDFIFVDGFSSAVSYDVYDKNYYNDGLNVKYASDHHPITAELKITAKASSENIDFGFKDGTGGSVNVNFNETWFEKDNRTYNHGLAKFCADYVMMGYCENNEKMKDYLEQMDFEISEVNMNTGRDEVNYFIASKDITVNGESETLVFAGFIGSHEKQWYSNFDPYGTERSRNYAGDSEKGDVHLGFADAREFVYAKLKEFISENNINKDNMKLLLSGHSRGAATANLLAAKLIDEAYANSSTAMVSKDDIYTYTFATPNTASTDKNVFADKYKCIFNIVNPEDFVTKVLLNDWGFYRYGKTYVLPSKTNDSQYLTYLNKMRPLFKSYNGKTYDPYKMGEVKTTNIIKSMCNNVCTLDELYTDSYTYTVSISDGIEKQSPFNFFKKTLLKYLVDDDKSEILRIVATCSLFYKNIIQYFAWPDANTNSVLEIGGKFRQAHQMETYCAYMNAMTSSQIKQTRLYYENTVNCPVDIEIYDNATNELVGKITNNVIDETVAAKENAIVMDVEGDSKSFYLPSNGDYRIVLTGNDDGTMDYSVSSIDSDSGETERLNFFDVEIENGVSMEGEINAEEFVLEEYTLNHEENGVIEPTEKLEGDELQDVSVNTTSEGAGYADGSITVTSGDYVTVTATANENNNFIGWYENGVLVSNDAEYSFVAKENRNLVAKFTNNYAIEWNVDGEITTTYCEAGSAITTLENPVKSGYKFIGWTPAIPNVMPAENLSFTAVWGPLFTSEIRKPSTTTINYGDSIILHADISGELPSGYYVEWTASNNNFSYKANGATCTITPEKSGDTTFTATIYDADGNPVSTDEQTMTSKAGFFQKIIAFFKKLFGLTKTIPNVFEF